MRLLLIRHGETDFNRKQRYCGITNPPLNKKGISQARRLARLLKNKRIDIVYASPLRRTYQTAQIIFGNTRHHIQKITALQEINFGLWEKLTFNELVSRYPGHSKRWMVNPFKTRAPEGESVNNLRRRVIRFFKKTILPLRRTTKTVVLVTHGGPIKVILGEIRSRGIKDFWKFNPETGSLNILRLAKKI